MQVSCDAGPFGTGAGLALPHGHLDAGAGTG